MGVRSESTRLGNHLRTDPVATEGGPQGAGASSAGAEAGAVASPEVSAWGSVIMCGWGDVFCQDG